MDRLNYQGVASLQSDVEANWRGSTVRDFNNNGKPDIVKTNYATGENAFWLMNGFAYQGDGNVITSAADGSGINHSHYSTFLPWGKGKP